MPTDVDPKEFLLEPAVQSRLALYFPGLDLTKVVVHIGIPWYMRLVSAIDARAYTSGHRINYAPGQYDSVSAGGLASIGHELVHVRQYQEYGLWGFRWRYVWAYLRGRIRRLGRERAYRENPYEEVAYAMEERLRAALSD